MKYVFVEEVRHDRIHKEFNSIDEAIKYADIRYEKMRDYVKKQLTAFYILESINPDPFAINHFDGDVIKDYM